MTRIIRKKWRASMAAAGALTLLLTGCGARLTAAQEAALNGAAGSAGGGGASGGQLQAAGSGGSTQAASSSTVPGLAAASGGGAESGQASTSAKTGTAASSSGGGGSSGASTVAPADDPLAGPNGKLCPAGAPSSDPGVTAKTITVGNIATINGPVPGLFAGARYGAEAVAAYINSMGGLCGRQLVVDSADDQFDQATDQNEASSMASQVLAFMGSFSLQDAGIPAGAPNVPDIGEALSSQRFDSPMNFSPSPEAPGYQTSAYQWFIQSPVYHEATQHMALLVENTPQTAQTGTWEESALQSVGFKFIFVDKTLQPTDPTFNGDVQKMKAAGVQGVIFQATGQITGQLANAMYQAGMKIVLGNYSPAAYDPAYLQNAGPGAAGTILSQSMALYDGQDANQVPMVATLDQWYARVDPGQVPDVYAVYSWLAGLLLAQAINTTGAPTRANIVAGIKQIGQFNGDGLVAPGDPATKTPPTCFVLIDVKNGQFVRDPATPTGFKCSPAGYYHA